MHGDRPVERRSASPGRGRRRRGRPRARLVIDSLPPVAAALAWRKRDQIGLRFIEEQRWVGDLVAQRFDPAAWLDRR
jgi:hypothetical protein